MPKKVTFEIPDDDHMPYRLIRSDYLIVAVAGVFCLGFLFGCSAQ